MVIEFSLANFRSFNKIQTISFRTTGTVSEDREVDDRNIVHTNGHSILKMLGIYGANASGKSNLIKGFGFFKDLVSNSLEIEGLIKAKGNAFKLSEQPAGHHGFFQIVLLLNNKKYRYGFTLGKEDIENEWLYGPAEIKETFYFKRNKEHLQINEDRFKEGLSLPKEKLRSDALFLNFVSSFSGEVASLIRTFISEKITVDGESGFYSTFSKTQTNQLFQTGKKAIILKWLKEAGLNFSDIRLNNVEINDQYYEFVTLFKNVYNSDGEISRSVPMYLNSEESQGTQKFYSYIGKLNQIFEEGGLYIADEIDSNFHPTLLRKLLTLFQNKDINKKNAQLLFTSHDTNLMDSSFLRRDQFYFTEKSIYDESILYSLADLKGIRNNADFAKQYLTGFYGALPVLGNYLENEEQ